MQQLDERLLSRAFAPARELTESDAIVTAALAARSVKPPWWKRRWALLGVLVVVLVPASAVAINEIAAEPGSAGDAFSNYLAGVDPETWPGVPYEGDPPPGPGTGIPSAELRENYADPRILARRGPAVLYIARTEDGGGLLLQLPGLGIGMSREDLFESADRDLLRLGGGIYIDEFLRRGMVPLYGLVDADVSAVRVIYRSGPRSPQVRANGGFIILVDPKRKPARIQGLDPTGRVVGEIPAGGNWHEAIRAIHLYRSDHSD